MLPPKIYAKIYASFLIVGGARCNLLFFILEGILKHDPQN